jgi:hypothetical protein
MKQLTIPTDGHSGEFATLTRILGEAGINIECIDAEEEDEGGQGVLVLTVNRYDEALCVLRSAGFRPITEDALVIRVADEPGALAKVAARFSDAGVNIRSLHIARRQQGSTLVSLVTSDNDAAALLVADLIVLQKESS